MKKLYLFFTFIFLLNAFLFSEDKEQIKKSLSFKKEDKKTNKNKTTQTVSFNYNNEDINNIINKLAALKRVNIVLPQPPAKINAKVTFSKPDEISIDEAWNILTTILDLAGYTIVPKENLLQIVPNANATREPLPLYINGIETLPQSDDKIRYMYFFENISVSNKSSASYINLDTILRDLLATEAEGATYILDDASNSLIIVGKSSAITGIMKVIKELDVVGFREAIEILPLVYTKSDFISKIINQLIPGEQEPQFRYGPFPPKASKTGSFYFSESTKAIPIERTNSLAILGPPDSVKRLIEFIQNHLDQPIESEKSVLHIKPLQYLNADDAAVTLQNLVKAKSAASQAESQEKDSLANVVIVAEKQVKAESINPTATPQSGAAPKPTAPIIGGNRLIVAARESDWRIISRLIDQIDQPQLQVALEVLIVDITLDDTRALGSQLRNMLNGTRPASVNFQTNNLTDPAFFNFVTGGTVAQPVPTNTITPQGLASDFSTLTNNAIYSSDGNPLATPANVATLTAGNPISNGPPTEPGATILTFKNGNGIASVLEILDQYDSTTILSKPFVVTANNLQANVSIATTRIVEGAVDNQSTGGPIVRKQDTIKADLTVNILPRISKSGNINLEIAVNANEFDQPANLQNNTINTRQVRTNSNLKNKEVLIIGGLSRVDTNDVTTQTPLLSKIPILGYLFKKRKQDIAKTNLMLFISPTIIYPRLQGGVDDFTETKIKYIEGEVQGAEIDIQGSIFEKLRDPITRVYFTPIGRPLNSAISYFAEQGAFGAGEDTETKEEKAEEDSKPITEPIFHNPEVEAQNLNDVVKKGTNPFLSKTRHGLRGRGLLKDFLFY